MSALYRLQNLDYSYEWNKQKVPVLKTLNISFDEACFCCIVGPSGSGKTTLLNLLGLLDSPTNGQIIFGGQDVGNLPEREKENIRLHQVGFVFQSFYLIPTLTILENTSYFLPSLGYSQADAKKTALETLDLLGIANHAHKKPLELSGGQRQRAAIARAIAKKPSVVLADEPTANLDSETSEKIIGAFKELQKSQRTSFIFSTHDAHLVKYAETIHHIKDGQISTGA
ncbi:ABC transporter ATP-binding protein [Bdellovibrio sp. ZAP7]|uniref:ABC transporter ATP-binding protein n=1 Tax=Bdellovibrio sp. ZAP7 TaxID=2231053 RepID=UPI00115A6767|nr:ATP-binding cassette domain-containing protein [Bdellovibrio sp. ZAP7]QDK43755.1 ABC transporter ATP-binding protein [Bdellovibrio sp. ZAP7]